MADMQKIIKELEDAFTNQELSRESKVKIVLIMSDWADVYMQEVEETIMKLSDEYFNKQDRKH